MEEEQIQQCQLHSLIADVGLFAGNRVLLVRYKDINRYDHQAGWFLPDDALRRFEHPEMAAKRILKEQLNITIPKVSLGFIESFKGHDGTWHLAFHYRADPDTAALLEPSEDLKTAQWFGLDQLPERDEVAHYGWALSTIRELTQHTT